jgi:hypothetical protein
MYRPPATAARVSARAERGDLPMAAMMRVRRAFPGRECCSSQRPSCKATSASEPSSNHSSIRQIPNRPSGIVTTDPVT